MTDQDFDSTKLPGKTQYSGRRRPMTRDSGFHSHPDATGGKFLVENVPTIQLAPGRSLSITFHIPVAPKGSFVGFGLWFLAPESVKCEVKGQPSKKHILTAPCSPDWSKVGGMWRSEGVQVDVVFKMVATDSSVVALWQPACGIIQHDHLDNARSALLKNMYTYSPEAHFFSEVGEFEIDSGTVDATFLDDEATVELVLKECNRCARFLPINVHDERRHLSFTNHCVAEHRLPCSHTGFGKLTNAGENGPSELQLKHGYQLECRFCKKFEVNAAHNPQRTAAQMKEDGTRRRAIELLLTELYGESPQLRYRHRFGGELANDIWERFERKCFNCGASLDTINDMHLDHTRPLALLWQLDETATALCVYVVSGIGHILCGANGGFPL